MTEHYENWMIQNGEVKKATKAYPDYEGPWVKIGQTPSEIQYSVRLEGVDLPLHRLPYYWVDTVEEARKVAQYILSWYAPSASVEDKSDKERLVEEIKEGTRHPIDDAADMELTGHGIIQFYHKLGDSSVSLTYAITDANKTGPEGQTERAKELVWEDES